MGQGKDGVGDSPSEIREAIAQARAELGAQLSALSHLTLPSGGDGPGDETMPTPKKSNEGAVKGAKTSGNDRAESNPSKDGGKKSTKPKKSGASASSPRKSSKTTTTRDVAAKAGHVLDTMAAGAVVGAVKAAAQAIAQDEARAPKGKKAKAPSTGEVLGDLAPDVAVGAIVGAAKAVMPEEKNSNGSSPSAAKPKAARPKTGKK